MAFLWRGYVGLLQRHTLVTQMATGGFTSGIGDVIYQQGIERRGWQSHEVSLFLRRTRYGRTLTSSYLPVDVPHAQAHVLRGHLFRTRREPMASFAQQHQRWWTLDE
jgi:hypothetical protein